MSDVIDTVRAPPAAKTRGVRARDAASLILLRGEGRDLELLAGRRPMSVRFMPGVYVFPGGAVDAEDHRAWHVEVGAESLPPRLVRCARAALRETWEEAGVLFGRNAAAPLTPRPETPIAAAYAAAGAVAPIDKLRYVGRAITPVRVFRRFNTRFFVGEGDEVIGDPHPSDELEDVRWHPIGREPLEPLRDVSQFMLARAIALRSGDPSPPPLFYTVGGRRRIAACREGLVGG